MIDMLKLFLKRIVYNFDFKFVNFSSQKFLELYLKIAGCKE